MYIDGIHILQLLLNLMGYLTYGGVMVMDNLVDNHVLPPEE